MGKVSDAIPSDSNRKHVGHFSIWPTSWPLFIFQLCIRSFNLQSFKHFVLLSKRSTDFQVPSKRNDIRLLTQWWHSNFSFVISSYFPRASTSFHWFQQLTTFLLRVRDCSSLENWFSKSFVFFLIRWFQTLLFTDDYRQPCQCVNGDRSTSCTSAYGTKSWLDQLPSEAHRNPHVLTLCYWLPGKKRIEMLLIIHFPLLSLHPLETRLHGGPPSPQRESAEPRRTKKA